MILEETVEVPSMDRWRLTYLCYLLSERREGHSQGVEAGETRIEELIESLVIRLLLFILRFQRPLPKMVLQEFFIFLTML